MWESLGNGVVIMVVFGLEIWPSLIDCVHYFGYACWVVHDMMVFCYWFEVNKVNILNLVYIYFMLCYGM